MESGRILRNSQIIVLGLCIAAATIVSSLILSQGFLKIAQFTKEVINVTGSAQKQITSDYAVWQVDVSARDADLPTAYRNLVRDMERLQRFLQSKGLANDEMWISQVFTYTLYKKDADGNDTNEIEGYRLSQTLTAKSADVKKISRLSGEATELIVEGIKVNSQAPQYFYTKLDQLKVEMLAEATKNAKQRAENMVQATGNLIGTMRSARMGVFQITPVTSTDVSDYGENDTSALEKKVMAVVSVTFSIE